MRQGWDGNVDSGVFKWDKVAVSELYYYLPIWHIPAGGVDDYFPRHAVQFHDAEASRRRLATRQRGWLGIHCGCMPQLGNFLCKVDFILPDNSNEKRRMLAETPPLHYFAGEAKSFGTLLVFCSHVLSL